MAPQVSASPGTPLRIRGGYTRPFGLVVVSMEAQAVLSTGLSLPKLLSHLGRGQAHCPAARSELRSPRKSL